MTANYKETGTADPNDILHNGQLDGLTDYGVFKLRYPRRETFPTRLLTDWYIQETQLTAGPRICIVGTYKSSVIRTSPVVDIQTSRRIVTNNCIYILGEGSRVLEHDVRDGMNRLFADGFPENWREVIRKAFTGDTNAKEARMSESSRLGALPYEKRYSLMDGEHGSAGNGLGEEILHNSFIECGGRRGSVDGETKRMSCDSRRCNSVDAISDRKDICGSIIDDSRRDSIGAKGRAQNGSFIAENKENVCTDDLEDLDDISEFEESSSSDAGQHFDEAANDLENDSMGCDIVLGKGEEEPAAMSDYKSTAKEMSNLNSSGIADGNTRHDIEMMEDDYINSETTSSSADHASALGHSRSEALQQAEEFNIPVIGDELECGAMSGYIVADTIISDDQMGRYKKMSICKDDYKYIGVHERPMCGAEDTPKKMNDEPNKRGAYMTVEQALRKTPFYNNRLAAARRSISEASSVGAENVTEGSKVAFEKLPIPEKEATSEQVDALVAKESPRKSSAGRMSVSENIVKEMLEMDGANHSGVDIGNGDIDHISSEKKDAVDHINSIKKDGIDHNDINMRMDNVYGNLSKRDSIACSFLKEDAIESNILRKDITDNILGEDGADSNIRKHSIVDSIMDGANAGDGAASQSLDSNNENAFAKGSIKRMSIASGDAVFSRNKLPKRDSIARSMDEGKMAKEDDTTTESVDNDEDIIVGKRTSNRPSIRITLPSEGKRAARKPRLSADAFINEMNALNQERMDGGFATEAKTRSEEAADEISQSLVRSSPEEDVKANLSLLNSHITSGSIVHEYGLFGMDRDAANESAKRISLPGHYSELSRSSGLIEPGKESVAEDETQDANECVMRRRSVKRLPAQDTIRRISLDKSGAAMGEAAAFVADVQNKSNGLEYHGDDSVEQCYDAAEAEVLKSPQTRRKKASVCMPKKKRKTICRFQRK